MLHELGFEYAKQLRVSGGLSHLEMYRKTSSNEDEVSPADAGRGGLFTSGKEYVLTQ